MRVLIIEDEKDFATALATGLRREGYAVDVANDGASGWEMADVNPYDLLLLDLNLPELDGLQICQRLRESQPKLLIFMLTARSQPSQKIAGLDLGADDYLVKPFHFGELLARMRALLRRDMRVRDPLLTFQNLKLDPASQTVWRDNQKLELTNKEFGILEYMMRHSREVVTQEQLIEHVWDINVNPFTTTVRVHINSLRNKLSLSASKSDTLTTDAFIETVVGKGYRLNSGVS